MVKLTKAGIKKVSRAKKLKILAARLLKQAAKMKIKEKIRRKVRRKVRRARRRSRR